MKFFLNHLRAFQNAKGNQFLWHSDDDPEERMEVGGSSENSRSKESSSGKKIEEVQKEVQEAIERAQRTQGRNTEDLYDKLKKETDSRLQTATEKFEKLFESAKAQMIEEQKGKELTPEQEQILQELETRFREAHEIASEVVIGILETGKSTNEQYKKVSQKVSALNKPLLKVYQELLKNENDQEAIATAIKKLSNLWNKNKRDLRSGIRNIKEILDSQKQFHPRFNQMWSEELLGEIDNIEESIVNLTLAEEREEIIPTNSKDIKNLYRSLLNLQNRSDFLGGGFNYLREKILQKLDDFTKKISQQVGDMPEVGNAPDHISLSIVPATPSTTFASLANESLDQQEQELDEIKEDFQKNYQEVAPFLPLIVKDLDQAIKAYRRIGIQELGGRRQRAIEQKLKEIYVIDDPYLLNDNLPKVFQAWQQIDQEFKDGEEHIEDIDFYKEHLRDLKAFKNTLVEAGEDLKAREEALEAEARKGMQEIEKGKGKNEQTSTHTAAGITPAVIGTGGAEVRGTPEGGRDESEENENQEEDPEGQDNLEHEEQEGGEQAPVQNNQNNGNNDQPAVEEANEDQENNELEPDQEDGAGGNDQEPVPQNPENQNDEIAQAEIEAGKQEFQRDFITYKEIIEQVEEHVEKDLQALANGHLTEEIIQEKYGVESSEQMRQVWETQAGFKQTFTDINQEFEEGRATMERLGHYRGQQRRMKRYTEKAGRFLEEMREYEQPSREALKNLEFLGNEDDPPDPEKFKKNFKAKQKQFKQRIKRYNHHIKKAQRHLNEDKNLKDKDFKEKYGASREEIHGKLQGHRNLREVFDSVWKPFKKGDFADKWLEKYRQSETAALRDFRDWGAIAKASDEIEKKTKELMGWSQDYENKKKNIAERIKDQLKTFDFKFISISGLMLLGKRIGEKWKRETEDQFKAESESLGSIIPGSIGQEFELLEGKRHSENVKEFEGLYEGNEIWQIFDTMKKSKDKDEIMACINLANKKGGLKWDSIPIWQALNNLKTGVRFNVPHDIDHLSYAEIADKARRAITQAWWPGVFEEWDRSLAGNQESMEKNYARSFERDIENIPGKIAEMLRDWRSGNTDQLHPAKFLYYIKNGFKRGKSAEDFGVRYYFLIQGVSAKNPQGDTLLSQETFKELTKGEYYAEMPHTAFFVDKKSKKKDGKIDPVEGIVRRWNLNDYRIWAQEMGDAGGTFDVKQEELKRRIRDFFYQNMNMSEKGRAQARSNSKQVDGDDGYMDFCAFDKDKTELELQTTPQGPKRPKEYWESQLRSFDPFIESMYAYMQEGESRYGNRQSWREEKNNTLRFIGERLENALIVIHTIQGNYRPKKQSLVSDKPVKGKEDLYTFLNLMFDLTAQDPDTIRYRDIVRNPNIKNNQNLQSLNADFLGGPKKVGRQFITAEGEGKKKYFSNPAIIEATLNAYMQRKQARA